MKTLEKFAIENGLTVEKVRYRHGFGYCKRKGYDLISINDLVFASFEPCDFSNGDKWYLRNGKSKMGSYFKRITSRILESIYWDNHPDRFMH